ncbi:hypothetical protein GE21DRAFT_2803 [Neurospora crassa]|uniref:Chromatin modification-related protein n=1 Tax=Neurospora crassa (strain ATCC 24698 / 74-OR23-1A / CBS 708.71 / DSM 1257 / FGSC 987) TaxID=367110 RepID=Q7RWJ4_NEUCR|nr:hypothetical protein NCU03461 [Neurospora crassa OR74A]EAA26816.2 hypothetical protein NCU03461 [Neurospora crassa OR74A]KHE86341.1 hypothetical protein GE21DRAFT_2803 [Neurospora crassa]|eukprot:XP_956052.2 hypothetical protein NCU03461 [Neurospora crassa OR74A]
MKTAKPPAAEAPSGPSGSNRRAQPVRQTRINPPRTSSLNRTNSFPNGPTPEQPIDIFPAVTHFTDAITALPKELVRHFTLLKEVDAKIFAPEATLFELVDAALKAPVPDRTRSVTDGNNSVAPASTPMSAQNSTSGRVASNANPATVPPSITDSAHAAVFDPTNLPRRHLFRQAAWKIQEMLVSLEEKNHVISTANDALHKQLSRIEEIWPHLENEFSDEAKWGSTTHWAYAENRVPKTNHKEAERSRREGAATLSAAAQQIAEEAAARSSDRKQALAAKKNNKGQATEPEADSKAQETTKKGPGTGKSRKHQAEATPVGLGIANGTPTNGTGPSKRRKVEKEPKANGSAPMERAMSSVFGNGTAKSKTTASPRGSPAPDGATPTGPTTKKRKALPSGSTQAKKSRTNAANSPSVAASPLLGSLPDTKAGRNSPVPLPPRPASSRARGNSTASTTLPIQQRPATATTNKPNGITPAVAEAVPQSKSTSDAKAPKEADPPAPTPAKTEAAKPETEIKPPVPPEPVANASTSKKENSKAVTAPAEEPETKKRTNSIVSQTAILPPPISTTVTTTKSGRASKPSTPATGTFAEAANATTTTARSRPSRNSTNQSDKDSNSTSGKDTFGNSTTTTSGTTTSKRSHKKGASSVSAVAVSVALQDEKPGKSAAASDEKKDAASDENSGRPTTSGRGKGSAAAHRDSKAERGSERDRGGERDTKTETNHGHGHGRRGTATAAAARAQQQQPQHQQRQEEEDDDDDDDDVDADEQRYCFCNGISYGEMVACDGDGCPREWFHLECVGLKVAPKGNAKWYCEDCKKRLRASGR